MSDVTRRQLIKALGALVGCAAASQFDRQLETMARALSGPQEWVLTFDEQGLERLIDSSPRIIDSFIDTWRGVHVLTGHVVFSESDLWALATLTTPDGDEWRTVDGETWTFGDRRMTL